MTRDLLAHPIPLGLAHVALRYVVRPCPRRSESTRIESMSTRCTPDRRPEAGGSRTALNSGMIPQRHRQHALLRRRPLLWRGVPRTEKRPPDISRTYNPALESDG